MPLHILDNHLIEDSLIAYKNIKSNRFECYQSINRASKILAVEISKILDYNVKQISTITRNDKMLCLQDNIVLVAKIRSGLIMLDPFIEVYHTCLVAHILIGRSSTNDGEGDKILYGPRTLSNNKYKYIILDPLVATGNSILKIIEHLQLCGVSSEQIIIATLLCSQIGCKAIQRVFPSVTHFVGSLTEVLDSNAGVYPKIGDLGDRVFGLSEYLF